MTIKRYDVASTLWLRLLITLLLLSGLSAPSFGAEDSYVPQIEYLRVAPDNKLTVSEALASDSWQTLEEKKSEFWLYPRYRLASVSGIAAGDHQPS